MVNSMPKVKGMLFRLLWFTRTRIRNYEKDAIALFTMLKKRKCSSNSVFKDRLYETLKEFQILGKEKARRDTKYKVNALTVQLKYPVLDCSVPSLPLEREGRKVKPCFIIFIIKLKLSTL